MNENVGSFIDLFFLSVLRFGDISLVLGTYFSFSFAVLVNSIDLDDIFLGSVKTLEFVR